MQFVSHPQTPNIPKAKYTNVVIVVLDVRMKLVGTRPKIRLVDVPEVVALLPEGGIIALEDNFQDTSLVARGCYMLHPVSQGPVSLLKPGEDGRSV